MIEFEVVRCPKCGAVVGDGLKFDGLFRPICPGCKRRIWIQGPEMKVVRVDKRPSKLPKVGAIVAA